MVGISFKKRSLDVVHLESYTSYKEYTETHKIKVPLDSFICYWIQKFCISNFVAIRFVPIRTTPEKEKSAVTIVEEEGDPFIFLINEYEIPWTVALCVYPVIMAEDVIITGLCAVARQICIFRNFYALREEHEDGLLGFRNTCLQAPNEVSVWTKFCEVEIVRTAHNLITDGDIKEVPNALVRFEDHMRQPVRIHNVYKVAQNIKKESISAEKARAKQQAAIAKQQAINEPQSNAADQTKPGQEINAQNQKQTTVEQQENAKQKANVEEQANTGQQAKSECPTNVEEQANTEQQAKSEYPTNVEQQANTGQQAKSECPTNVEEQANTEQQAKSEYPTNAEEQANTEQQAKSEYPTNAEEQANTEQQAKSEYPTNAEEQANTEQQAKSEYPTNAEEQANTEQQAKSEYPTNAEEQVNTEQQAKSEHPTNVEQANAKHQTNDQQANAEQAEQNTNSEQITNAEQQAIADKQDPAKGGEGSSSTARTSKTRKWKSNKKKEIAIDCSTKVEDLEVNHDFAEGPYLTLADLVLLPSYYVIIKTIGEPRFASVLPFTYKWYTNLISIPRIKKIFMPLVSQFTLTQLSFNLHMPRPDEVSLYKCDPKRHNPKKRIYTKDEDIEKAISSIKDGMELTVSENMFQPSFRWRDIPEHANPYSGYLPDTRVQRKSEQLENLAQAVLSMATDGDVIVDFCCGTGHLGILLAHLLPRCTIILLENKVQSLYRAKERVKKMRLTNVFYYQCNLDFFIGEFDIGIGLHACGMATDLILEKCLKQNARFVLSPCCYGAIHGTCRIKYPRSKMFSSMSLDEYLCIANAADQTHKEHPLAVRGARCMTVIDSDRARLAEEYGYKVTLLRLKPCTCTPKNNLIIGISTEK